MFFSRLKRRLFSKILLTRFLLLVLVGVFLLTFFRLIIYPLAPKVFDQRELVLANSNGKTNILLLGIGGGQHEGAKLTDSMMVISVTTKLDSMQLVPPPIVVISIPRDIFVASIGGKVNEAYEIGGLSMSKTIVSEITGLPIHYGLVADFSVFEKIIDHLGGIDVNVPVTFEDKEYPMVGHENDPCETCRYETIKFDAGWQHMDGATALKFVRSRKASGDEGTDFARSRRQQLVMKAVFDKTFSLKNILNISTGLAIYNEVKNNIDTDFDFSNPNMLLSLAVKYRGAKFQTISVDEGQLYNPPEDYRGWILLPIGGDWKMVHQFIATKSAQIQP